MKHAMQKIGGWDNRSDFLQSAYSFWVKRVNFNINNSTIYEGELMTSRMKEESLSRGGWWVDNKLLIGWCILLTQIHLNTV